MTTPRTIAAAALLAATALTACGSDASSDAGPAQSAVVEAVPSDGAATQSLLPRPTGPSAVGVTDLDAIGTSRVTAWYPTEGTAAPHADYLPADMAAAFGLDAGALARLAPSARRDATIAPLPGPAPVVVLTTGWASPLALSTSLAEELASHGHVVIGLDPAPGTEAPDRPPTDEDGRRRIAEIVAAIDAIESGSVGFDAPLDLTRLAVGGHSFGGATAYEAALEDDRIAAVFDLDGTLHRQAAVEPPSVPALLVTATNSGAISQVKVLGDDVVAIALADAAHDDLTDVAAIRPALGQLAALFETAGIGPDGPRVVNTLVRRFLTSPTAAPLDLVEDLDPHVSLLSLGA